jgi:hypothetical protein
MKNLERIEELMVPIDLQIARCMNPEELLMLSCGMLQRCKEIFDNILSEEGRIKMFEGYLK